MSETTARPNGAAFFTRLEAQIIQAHDDNRLNEDALARLIAGVNRGEALTLDALAEVFGIEPVYRMVLDARVLDDLARTITAHIKKELEL